MSFHFEGTLYFIKNNQLRFSSSTLTILHDQLHRVNWLYPFGLSQDKNFTISNRFN